MIELISNFISAKIDPFGGQLVELRDLESGIEYICAQKGPISSQEIFFPVVGALLDQKYRLGRTFYRMPENGFLFNRKFEVVEFQKDRVRLRVFHSEETMELYPFKFSFTIDYKVYGPRLMMTYEVKNLDRSEMYFSFGTFPAFRVPIKCGDREDYFLEFEREEKRGGYYLTRGLINFEDPDDKSIFTGKRIFLGQEVLADRLVILNDPQSKKIALKNSVDSHSIVFDFDNIPYLAIYHHPKEHELQIGPWFGVADAINSNYDFYKKEGLISLEAEKRFQAHFFIHVY